eukprot:GHVL01026480.1.p1 GENE.GHVL01026480.1~~GHVL01026480.1.p1  ORF type:complete len:326 (+),score=56.74 GHVL01026480.1:84-1061(+)
MNMIMESTVLIGGEESFPCPPCVPRKFHDVVVCLKHFTEAPEYAQDDEIEDLRSTLGGYARACEETRANIMKIGLSTGHHQDDIKWILLYLMSAVDSFSNAFLTIFNKLDRPPPNTNKHEDEFHSLNQKLELAKRELEALPEMQIELETAKLTIERLKKNVRSLKEQNDCRWARQDVAESEMQHQKSSLNSAITQIRRLKTENNSLRTEMSDELHNLTNFHSQEKQRLTQELASAQKKITELKETIIFLNEVRTPKRHPRTPETVSSTCRKVSRDDLRSTFFVWIGRTHLTLSCLSPLNNSPINRSIRETSLLKQITDVDPTCID